MKKTIILLLFLSVFICKAQVRVDRPNVLSCDYDIESEVKEIIINYKELGIKKFKIKYKQLGAWSDVFYYSLINDSSLVFTGGSDTAASISQYVIRNNIFYDYSPCATTRLGSLYRIIDSANTTYYNNYTVSGKDTILGLQCRVTRDALKRETELLQWDNRKEGVKQKFETSYCGNDIIEEKWYTFVYNAWQLKSDCKTQTTVINVRNRKTTFKNSNCILGNPYINCSNNHENEETSSKSTVIVYYNKKKLITKLTKTGKDLGSDYTYQYGKDKLIPVVLKK